MTDETGQERVKIEIDKKIESLNEALNVVKNNPDLFYYRGVLNLGVIWCNWSNRTKDTRTFSKKGGDGRQDAHST